MAAQAPPSRKKLLAIGEEKGYRHEAVSHALATIERLGRETGIWDTCIRTDTEPLTKKKLEYNAKNLNDFDAVLFFTGGMLEMDDQKKADFLSFIHDDGKGFIGIHSATITLTKWPDYGDMIGGYFGVGTFSYHTLSMDDMIVQLKRLKIQEIEMSRGEFMLMKPPTAAMCWAVRDKFDQAGIRCVSYYTATIENDRDLDLAVEFAKILGARNVSGDATGPILGRIDRRFTAEGLTFGIHNHWFPQKFAYESAEDVLHGLAGLSETVGATLDVGQMAACGHDPVKAVRRLVPRLKVVHLKDVAGAGAEHNVPFGRGIVPIPDVMRELRRIDFKGLVAIEYEKDTNSNEDMKYLVEYARRLS